jgi:hypothetical protein
MHPCSIVLLDSPSLLMNNIALHACPRKSTLGLHHIVLSSQEGVLLLNKFPLPHQELLLQLHNHRRLEHIRRSPKLDDGQKSASEQKSIPKWTMVQGRNLPKRRRCPIGGDIRPRSLSGQRADLTVGILAMSTLARMVVASHYGQQRTE